MLGGYLPRSDTARNVDGRFQVYSLGTYLGAVQPEMWMEGFP